MGIRNDWSLLHVNEQVKEVQPKVRYEKQVRSREQENGDQYNFAEMINAYLIVM